LDNTNVKIFIVGLTSSGRTTVSKALADEDKYIYIAGSDWFNSTFRSINKNETTENYNLDLLNYRSIRLKINPFLFIDNVLDIIDAYCEDDNFVIDGITNPKDFVHLFDYNKDIIIFLNRADMPDDPKNHEGIALNIMRDYCLYLTTVGLLDRSRWLEYNFRIPGEDSDFVKQLGKHNIITITKSINKAIDHLKGELCKLQPQ